MRPMFKYAVLSLVLCSVGLFWAAQGQEAPRPANTPNTASTANAAGAVVVGNPVGISSCSGGGCHGQAIPKGTPPLGVPPEGAWRSAYTHWISYDNHAKAYSVLREERARKMMEQLAKIEVDEEGKPLPDGGKRKYHPDATQESRCLACHVNPALAFTPAEPRAKAAVENHRLQGVGCEACHGNASQWRDSHVRWGDGPGKQAQYEADGMIWLNDPVSRARACAGCHVGAPPDERSPEVRNMNHDMIAAGHPRLNFEFSSYQLMETPHWIEKDRRTGAAVTRDEGFHGRNWLIGRAVQMEQAMALLEYRTRPESADEVAPGTSLEAAALTTRERKTRHALDPWPELSEFNCYGCHQKLSPDFYPRNLPKDATAKDTSLTPTTQRLFAPLGTGSAARKPGSWVWDPLFGTARVFQFGDAKSNVEGKAIDAFLKLQEMVQLGRGAPVKQSELHKQAVAALEAWRRLSESLLKPQNLVLAERRKLLAGELPKIARWDELAQTYLGVRAFNDNREIPEVVELLRFQGSDPAQRVDSPPQRDPYKTREEFLRRLAPRE